ncbi:hypothetical protein LJC07_07455 [Christensenellaceae bacterium OttesenSCG-928-L17]|nr:hypothetical protein [Christensenellaceae bacterium OttesenSCG-928-L17]
MKKYLALLLVFALCWSVAFPVYAIEQKPDSLEEIGIEIPVFDNEDELETYFQELEQSKGSVVVTVGIKRKYNPNNSTCEVFINWTGTEIVSAFRYKELAIKSTNILNPTTYGVFGNGTTYTTHYVTASAIGTLTVGTVTVPIDVNQVRIAPKSFQVFSTNAAAWGSIVLLNHNVTIT